MERFKKLVSEKINPSLAEIDLLTSKVSIQELCSLLKPIKAYCCATDAQKEVDAQNAIINLIRNKLKDPELVELWAAMPYPKDGIVIQKWSYEGESSFCENIRIDGLPVMYPLRGDDPHAPRDAYHFTRFKPSVSCFQWLPYAMPKHHKYQPMPNSKIKPGAKIF